ncbi:unnamed protein product, partial [Urochloa humidicola]
GGYKGESGAGKDVPSQGSLRPRLPEQRNGRRRHRSTILAPISYLPRRSKANVEEERCIVLERERVRGTGEGERQR